MPALITLHAFCLQTSVVHLDGVGYRNYDVRDTSRNVPWLFPFTQGECWHNNHHAHVGKLILTEHWWEIDIGWIYIKLLEKLGLATLRNS